MLGQNIETKNNKAEKLAPFVKLGERNIEAETPLVVGLSQSFLAELAEKNPYAGE